MGVATLMNTSPPSTPKWPSFEHPIIWNASFLCTFKDAALQWYMCLPRPSISSYQDLVKKLVHQFEASRHRKMSTTILFNIQQGPLGSPREYLTSFNEAMIKVIYPHEEMFVRLFHNSLKACHFNESLAQRPMSLLAEVVTRAKCYIKGEESNA